MLLLRRGGSPDGQRRHGGDVLEVTPPKPTRDTFNPTHFQTADPDLVLATASTVNLLLAHPRIRAVAAHPGEVRRSPGRTEEGGSR